MKNIQVTRKKKLVNAVVPYWIMTHKNKTKATGYTATYAPEDEPIVVDIDV